MPQAPLNKFPFIGGSYLARSRNFDAQRTVNLYPEMSGSGNSKSIACLIGTPGTKVWDDFILNGPVRGLFRFTAEIGIIVRGNSVVKVDVTGTIETIIGAIPNLATPVSMASNGLIVMMVTGPEGYVIDPVAGTTTLIVDPDFHGADVVWFIDGYFVFNWPGTQKYQITDLYSTAIQPLKFASAEGSPDLLISLIVINNEIVLVGENSTEFHADSGNTDFPFEPIRGAFIEQGCAAKFSVAKITDGSGVGTAIWLSKNESGQGMVVRNVGYQPKRISDHALELALQGYSRIDDAVAYTYQQEGHNFYMLTFPTANATWCYDTSTELWHERAWRNPIDGSMNRHRSWNHMFFANKNLVGDCLNGTVYELDLDTYTDRSTGGYNETMPAIRQCPHLSQGDLWQIFDRLWIDMETGVGLNANIAMDGGATANVGLIPTLTLEWSDDGGYTFPNSMIVPIGRLGERKTRAVARRLGKSRDRVFRVTITDPVKRVLIDAGCNVRTAA